MELIVLKTIDIKSSNRISVENISTLIQKVEQIPIDKKTIPQNKLDLANRIRTSLFPWTGQFSPSLIEILLEYYAKEGDQIFDPFAGSGTTLFESARKKLSCSGTEINPSAYEMASTINFINLNHSERLKYTNQSKRIINAYLSKINNYDITTNNKNHIDTSIEEILEKILESTKENKFIHNIVINTVIRFINSNNNKKDILSKRFLNSLKRHIKIINSLPFNNQEYAMFHADARKTNLQSGKFDLIITSPPYINVHNYHQNYREAMEIAGWDLLKVAKSEFGSNRKNRGNRFLTVIQYSTDMIQSFLEMKRTLNDSGKIIMVIGRESKVRGISFENYKIVSALATGGVGFELKKRQERKFINRYGKEIYEDLLHFKPNGENIENHQDFSREVAIYFLKDAIKKADKENRELIKESIKKAYTINPSPIFELEESRRVLDE